MSRWQQSQKKLFFGLKVIDLGVTWSMYAKYEFSISYCSKVIVKVNVDNGQTDWQTRQKQYAPDLSIRGN